MNKLALLLIALAISPAYARDGSQAASGDRASHHVSAERSAARHNMFHTFREQLNKGFYTDPVSGWSEADQFMGNVENAQIDGKLSAIQAGKLEKEFQDKYQGGLSQGLQGGSDFSGKSGAVGSDDIGGIP